MYTRGELLHTEITVKRLTAFADETVAHPRHRLPIGASDYCVLVDELVRCDVPGKRGRMTDNLSSIIERMGLRREDWATSIPKLKQR